MQSEFDFGEAQQLMVEGHAVTRRKVAGTFFVVLMPALELPPYNTQDTSRKVNDRTAKWIGNETPLNCQPYYASYTREGNIWQPGWTPSMEDLFAKDWIIVDEGHGLPPQT